MYRIYIVILIIVFGLFSCNSNQQNKFTETNQKSGLDSLVTNDEIQSNYGSMQIIGGIDFN